MGLVPVILAKVDDDGQLTFQDAARGLLARHLSGLKGRWVDVAIKIHRQQRTSRQNRYYFGVVVPLIAEHCGYEKDEMHELLAMRFLRIEDDPVTRSPRRKRTPNTDTQEFADFVDACVRFGAELGVYIPAPGEAA